MRNVIAEFESLIGTLPAVSQDGLRSATEQAVKRISRAKDCFLGPNVKAAEEIAERLNSLIDAYDRLNERQKRLVAGAVYYFNLTDDHISDLKPLVGLDDDVAVLNYVLTKLGRTAQLIEI